MADFDATHVFISKGVVLSSWEATASGVGSALDGSGYPDKTVEVVGPTGGTTTLIIEGAMSATGPWTTLVDPQGNNLSFTNKGMEAILDNPRYIRPRAETVTSGAATILVKITSQRAPR